MKDSNNKKKVGKIISRIVVSLVLLAAVGAALWYFVFSGSGTNVEELKLVEIKKMKLTDAVSATGTILSGTQTGVYSTLSFNIIEINADLGDYVNEGDVLCVLDTADLALDIAQQKAALAQSRRTAQTQIETNANTLNNAQENLEGGKNQNLLTAQANVTNTTLDLDNKRRIYNEKLADYNNGTSQSLVSANATLASSEIDLENKQRTYNNNKTLFENGVIAKEEFTLSEKALESSQNAYNNAVIAVENVKMSLKQELENLEVSVKNAENMLENAQNSLNAITNAVGQEIEAHTDRYVSAQVSSNFESQEIAIEKLERNLEKSVITAPVSGTITAKYASMGKPGQGLLFLIEDTDNLKIETNIKEYDIVSVKPGLPVVIKTDATGDMQFSGKVSKIAPTSLKDAQGNTIQTSDVEYKTEIDVTSKEDILKVGMVARLSLILQEKNDVLAVPFDAIDEDNFETTCVFVPQYDESGKLAGYINVPVTLGLETDFYVEISGEGITEGTQIVANAALVTFDPSQQPTRFMSQFQ